MAKRIVVSGKSDLKDARGRSGTVVGPYGPNQTLVLLEHVACLDNDEMIALPEELDWKANEPWHGSQSVHEQSERLKAFADGEKV